MSQKPLSHPSTQATIDAWMQPGPHPAYHDAAKAQLRKQWPVLAKALDGLARRAELKARFPQKDWPAMVDMMSDQQVAMKLSELNKENK